MILHYPHLRTLAAADRRAVWAEILRVQAALERLTDLYEIKRLLAHQRALLEYLAS